MRHFIYYENGGPFPGTCLSCGNNKDLYDVGGSRIDGGNNMLCGTCAKELAAFIGYAPEAPLVAEMTSLQNEIVNRDKTIANIPNQVNGLIDGIRNSLADFIFAVSSGDNSNKPAPVQEPEPALSRDDEGVKTSAGQRKASGKSSSK